MLIVRYYIFKQVLANPRKYLPAEQASQLEQLPDLKKFLNLMEELIFSLCRDQLPSSNLLAKKSSLEWGKLKPSLSANSWQVTLGVMNFLKANNDFCNSLQNIFSVFEKNDVVLQTDELHPEPFSLKQYILPFIHALLTLQGPEPATFITALQLEQSKGFFACIDKRDQIDVLAKNYLRLRRLEGMITFIHSKYSPSEFREILNKLQKIPLPANFLASCEPKVLLARYDEFILATPNLQSPAVYEIFQDLAKFNTASTLYRLIRVAISNKHVPISYLPNLLSIGYFLASNPKCLERLINKMCSKNFRFDQQTALELVTLENERRTRGKISVRDFENLVCGPHGQMRFDYPSDIVNRQSNTEELAQYIIRKHYLIDYPDVHTTPFQLYRANYGFDHISRVVLLFQFLVHFLYLPGISNDPRLKVVLSENELFLLTLAVLCNAASRTHDDFSYVREEVTSAAIFRLEALTLGFTLDQVEPIALALENKNNYGAPRNLYQWLIHDSIRFDDLRFIDTLGKDELIDTFANITQAGSIRLNQVIANYKKVIGLFMKSNRLEMQENINTFLPSKALMYQISLEIAVNPSSIKVLKYDMSYLILGEIDLSLLFEPSPELLKNVWNKLSEQLVTKKPLLEEHKKVYSHLYKLISAQISESLSDLADYHLKNALNLENVCLLATRFLEDQSAKLTASPEFRELWRYASVKMKNMFYIFSLVLLLNKRIPFSYFSNAISIALNLYEVPYLGAYIETVVKDDLETIKTKGADYLAQASKLRFRNQPVDEQLKQLALGAHEQIYYPYNLIVGGKPLNHRSSIKKIARYIINKYYLKPYPAPEKAAANGVFRPFNGFDHASRALMLFQLLVRLLQEHYPSVLRNPHGEPLTDTQLRLIGLAVLCTDAANTNEYFYDPAAQAKIFKTEAILLGFLDQEIVPVAWALENKDNKHRPRDIFQSLIHDSAYLGNARLILNNSNSFRKEELDCYKALKATPGIMKFDRIIENYKKVVACFMISNRLQLQQNKDAFLAVKAMMYQLALDLAAHPLSPTVLKLDTNYLVLGEIDPLLLFDPGAELLNYAINKVFLELIKTKDTNLEYREIYFTLFTLISCTLSKPLEDLAEFQTEGEYNLNSIRILANRYFTDATLNLTATSEFQRLWDHGIEKGKKFFQFVSDLLVNDKKIPCAYLYNAISIILHLADTPFLEVYYQSADNDLASLKETGANLLEEAHKHFFPNQPFDLELKQLALGAHQQIRYPQWVVFEEKALNHQSPIEEIASYIISKYYLKLYAPPAEVALNGLFRPFHGFDHVSRAVMLFQLIQRLLQEHCPSALYNSNGKPLTVTQLRLIKLALLCHDAANTNECFHNEAAQAKIFKLEASLLGFAEEEIEPIAWALENKDNQDLPRNNLQGLIHDPDCLEYIRVILKNTNLFLKGKLDFYKALKTPEGVAKFDRIIESYKKILARFMTSDCLPLQQSKNPFLATKALMYQIALDLAVNPSNTGGLIYDARYLILGDIDPLMLFDPGPELLKHAVNKFYDEIEKLFLGKNFLSYREIFLNLFTLISCKISEPLAEIAKYQCSKNHTLGSIHGLLSRYLNDDEIKLTATPEFKKLWFHAADQLEKFPRFISKLLYNKTIPISYLHNAISIALHLATTPLLEVYYKCAEEDFDTLKKTGANLLEDAHKHLYSNQPFNPELKQLALGIHQQIRYPQRIIINGKLINHQSSPEEIALYIINRYYLKPYPTTPDRGLGSLLRPGKGFDHAARTLLLFQMIVRLFQEYHPYILTNPNGQPLSDKQLKLVALAVLCSHAADTSDNFNNDIAQVEIFKAEALLLGFSSDEIKQVASAMENKNDRKSPRNILQWLIHDSSYLELVQVSNNYLHSFQRYELDTYNFLNKPPASTKIDKIIANYKKIMNRFLSSNRVQLQNSNNSFLASKALLYQIAIDLAASPFNTEGLEVDTTYLKLGDIDPLMLFHPNLELLKYVENKAYQLLVTTDRDDSALSDYANLYYELFTLISGNISDSLGDLSKFLESESYSHEILHVLATRYFDDMSTPGVTVMPSFRVLWLHAYNIMDFQFYRFVSQLLCNQNIPFSYLTNAICIALHLADSAALKEYVDASGKADLDSFKALGAKLLKKAEFSVNLPASENAKLQLLALGEHDQIKYPPVFYGKKLINSQSPINDIAEYIIGKYYLKSYPGKSASAPAHFLFRPQHGFDHVSRCVFILEVLMRLLEEEAPELLMSTVDKKPLGEQEKVLLQLAILCHEAANLTDAEHDDKKHADIFRLESYQLGFDQTKFTYIASALINKGLDSPTRNVYQLLVRDPDIIEKMRFYTNNLDSFSENELDIYKHFVSTKNSKAIDKLKNIISKYKKILTGFMNSNRLSLQEHTNPFLATKAFVYQLAIHHTMPCTYNKFNFDPNAVAITHIDPIRLFDESHDFLAIVAKRLRYPKRKETAIDLFRTEGLYLRALTPSTDSSTRTEVEELIINYNKAIIQRSKLSNNAQSLWAGYLQDKLKGIKFRPVTYIKEDYAIMPYLDNKSVSFLMKANPLKYYKRNILSNDITKGNFNFQRTGDGVKGLDSFADFFKKTTEINARRLGKHPDPYNRYYGLTNMERNEIFLANYELSDVVGINIGKVDDNSNYEDNLFEALYWYVRLAIANQEIPNLYYFCPHIGKLISISLEDVLHSHLTGVQIPDVVKHHNTYFSDVQLQNPNIDSIEVDKITKAKINMIKLSGGTEIYNVTLPCGKKFSTNMHSRGFPIVAIEGEPKPTYDSKGLFRHTIRVYQEQMAQRCQKLLLDASSYLENTYRITSVDIKIMHEIKKYRNGEREKTYLHCEVIFLDNLHSDTIEFYYVTLQELLDITLDKRLLEVDYSLKKIIIRDRTPHKILGIFEKLDGEIKAKKEAQIRKDIPASLTP